MASTAPRIKLCFEGSLGQYLVEHNLQKCWYQLPALASPGSRMQTVADLINQIRSGFSLLSGDLPSLLLQLDGYTVLEGSSLDLFRDGDLVTIKVSQAALPLGWQEGSKKRRNHDTLSALAADAAQAELERPKKRRKVARAAGGTLNEPAAARLHPSTGFPRSEERGNKKRKRNSINGPDTTAGNQNWLTSLQTAADTTEAAADAPGAAANGPANAPGANANGPADLPGAGANGAADAPGANANEEQKQSRSARRKQLKRRFRRLGVAPPPQHPSSSSQHQSRPADPATASAAVQSSSHPGAAQADPPAPTPGTSGFPPPPKRLKTQPGKLRAQRAGDGHVYFGDSSSGSESSSEAESSSESESSSEGESAEEDQQPTCEVAVDGVLKRPSHIFSRQEGKPRPKLTPQNHQQGASTEEAGPSTPLPMTEADYAALPVVEGSMQAGAFIAYKLLEIGPDWAPQVSEWRQGEVDSTEASGTVVIKPLAGRGQLEQAPAEAEEEEEEDEGPPSNYDEDGVLTTELSSLSELRLIKAAAQSSATDLQAPTSMATPAETTTTSVTDTTVVNTAATAAGKTPAGDSSDAAAAGDQSSAQQASASAVPNVGAWAELSNQIAQRKAELARKAGDSSEAVNGVQGDDSGAVITERKVKVTGMQTPGAARPRGGVRASAMGPMLAFLRSSGGLDGNAS